MKQTAGWLFCWASRLHATLGSYVGPLLTVHSVVLPVLLGS